MRKKERRIDWSPVRSISSLQVASAVVLRLLLILALALLLGTLLQACSGSGGATGFVRNLESITIDPVNSSIAVSTKVQLHATGTYKNKTTKDITSLVTWESDDPSVTIVSNLAGFKGLAAGVGVGATTVRARLHGIAGVSTFTVTKASLTSITVQPVNPFVSKGTTVQLAAVGNFSDGSVQDLTTQVSWNSANSSIAQVSNTAGTMGLVTGVSVGNTPITATLNGVMGSTTVTVTAATLTSITITPPESPIAKGTTVQATATCNFSDGTTLDCTSLVSWTSDDSGIASVSDTSPTKGLVAGVAIGSTTISASFGGITGSAAVTVSDATLISITITPDLSIAEGTVVQLTATGNFSDGTTQDLTTQVSWTSSDETVAQVSNVPGTQGLVTGLSVGNVSIGATFDGIEGSTTVTVSDAILTSIEITPPDPSIGNGTTVQLTATGNFSDGTTEDLTTQVSWTSGNNGIAEVNNEAGSQGVVTGRSVGNTSISATLNGIEGSTTVTVTAATLTSITVTPTDPSIANGTTVQLTATGKFSDGTFEDLTTQVGWTSGNNAIAEVDNVAGSQGVVTSQSVGSTPISATLNGISGSTTVTVTAATLTSITVTPPDPSIAKGTTVQLIATGTFSDGSTQSLTTKVGWTSGNNAIATVSNAPSAVGGGGGLVTGVDVGSTPITATLKGISGSTTVTVTAATLESISVTPKNPTVDTGGTQQLLATGTFSNGDTEDITATADWTSDAPAIATVDSSGEQNGLVTGEAVGTATITAEQDGIKGSTTVTVATASEFAYVTDSIANTVSAFSVGADGVLRLVGMPESSGGTSPVAVAADPSGKFLYVVNSSSPGSAVGPGSVQAYDISPSGSTIGQLTPIGVPVPTGGNDSLGIAVVDTPSGLFAYVTNSASNNISAFAINSNGTLSLQGVTPPIPFGSSPKGVAGLPNGEFVYAGSNFNIGSYSVETGALSFIGTFASGATFPFEVAVDPLGNHVFTANFEETDVTGFNKGLSNFEVNQSNGSLIFLNNTTTMSFPVALAVDPNSEYVYVVGSNTIESFGIVDDYLEQEPTTNEAAGVDPSWVVADPSDRFVYVTTLGPPGGVIAYNVTAPGELAPINGGLPLPTTPAHASAVTVVPVP
jgi:6-phosphogluconolactonase (cycloisomerase 2 family)